MKKATLKLSAFGLLVIIANTPQAYGDLVTSSASFDLPISVVDFSPFGAFTTFSPPGTPVQIGGPVGEDITWESSFPGSVIGEGDYGLGGNGDWDSSKDFTGLVTGAGTMTFRFNAGPVSQVGGFMNYAPASNPADVFVEALDAADMVLESRNISIVAPIITGGLNAGEFRGIKRLADDIFAFRVSNQFVVLDDLTFHRGAVQAVPEPSTALLATIGAGVIGMLRMRRRKRTA